ncbi:S1/P1 nuclease [Flavimarina sp. Hel_I_48]|uniref:S1/P1 nuclease n=1 Tax=Flavimarina sp. Hel_I_48 TaxID=1392488 RepID=UPI0004DEFF69|nr:S1/P1 nuclease [Flavimarina sp. Hel_I_48]
MTRLLLVLLSVLLTTVTATARTVDDWGQNGHRTTAAIAEKYLSNRAERAIKRLLGDETLVTVSTYGDEIKSIAEMRKYSAWHYVNIIPGKTYAEDAKNPDGDLVMAINTCREVLLSKASTQQDKIFSLKMLVHLMGDLHQPLHVGRASDKGGNDLQVRWFNKGTNLHSVWDTQMIESYGMSYSELATNYGAVAKERYKMYSQGSLMDWVDESQQLVETVYNSAESGDKLGYAYMEEYKDTVFLQLEKGGIRLAEVLNQIFD